MLRSINRDGEYMRGYFAGSAEVGQYGTFIGTNACSDYGLSGQNTCIGASTHLKANGDSGEFVGGGYNCTGNGSNTSTMCGTGGFFTAGGGLFPGNGTSQGTPGYFSGTGVPTFSAPNGSQYLRFDGGTGARVYFNTSGASTSGTTWTALAVP